MAKTIADLIGETIFRKTVEAVTKPHVPVDNARAASVAHEVEKVLKPVMVNATNSEPLYQSRVIIGASAPVLAALSDLAFMYATGEWDTQRIITDLVVISGAAFAIYGRIFGAKLKPLGQ